ncbi:hypothetical protein ACI1MP_30170 [Kitasatospora griseola]|uniref:hypothetical protein n=1 Tax=Kitasatospora griseola TaxID=2064 RepID=UPI00385577C4
MTSAFHIDRVLADRPFAEACDPVLAVPDERRGLLAVAGRAVGPWPQPVAVYRTADLACVALARCRFPVHALAFHPDLPLLAIGTGSYDGGYFFDGELLLLDLESGAAVSLFEHRSGRQVLGLEWLDGRSLRLLLAPPDDWRDRAAWQEGHLAELHRDDWRAVAPASVPPAELAGPRLAVPRPDGAAAARLLLDGLHSGWEPRGPIGAVEELADGRLLLAMPEVVVECRTPSDTVAWSLRREGYGGEFAVAAGRRSVFVRAAEPPSVAEHSLTDGSLLARRELPGRFTLLACADGLPALVPFRPGDLRIRRGRLVYTAPHRRPSQSEQWLVAADPSQLPADDRPYRPSDRYRGCFPLSWDPAQTHLPGPGVELPDGSLVYAGTVHDGRGRHSGGSFVVRRSPADGTPRWVFRTDRPATALDLDVDRDAVHLAYDDAELVTLSATDGTVRRRGPLTVGRVAVVATALTVPGPGRLLLGTTDGRVLSCTT